MTMTNYSAQALTWALGSNLPNNYIQYFAVGSGSGTAVVTNTTLAGETGSRVLITGSPEQKSAALTPLTQGDFNTIQMSGIQLTEFGLFASGASQTGSVWQREAFSSITFDGTNELQVITTLEVIPG